MTVAGGIGLVIERSRVLLPDVPLLCSDPRTLVPLYNLILIKGRWHWEVGK